MRFIILLILCACIIIPGESVFGSRSGSRSSSRSGIFSSRRSSSNVGWNIPRSAKPKSGLSKTAKYALFSGAGLAAGVYLGSKFSGHKNYDFMRNDDRYNVCQGQYVEAPMSANQYFICPQTPMDFVNNRCCYDGFVGYCCSHGSYGGSYGTRVGSGVSGAIGSLIFLGAIGACIYCLCCKKKNVDSGQVEMYNPEPVYPDSDKGYSPPPSYPSQPPMYPQPQPGYPPQPQPGYPSQPQPGYPPQPQPGYPPQPQPGYPPQPQPGYPSSAPGFPTQGPGWNA